MTKARLLLIEDEPALQTLLFDVLSDAGYEVSVAVADDYLYMVHEVAPEVLVLGCDAGGSFDRGWEIAAALQRDLPDTGLILLSTSSGVVDEVGQTSRGKLFDAGIQKPFRINELLHAVAHTVERRSVTEYGRSFF